MLALGGGAEISINGEKMNYLITWLLYSKTQL